MRRRHPVADPRGGGGGGATGARPPKIGSTVCVLNQKNFIRMLKNKAQIAQESIKTALDLPGPFSGPWTPAESEFSSALVMCVRPNNFARPPKKKKKKKNPNPGSAPDTNLQCFDDSRKKEISITPSNTRLFSVHECKSRWDCL